MSMYGKVEGIIVGKGMRPTKTVQMKMRNGKMEKVPFMRFTMFCEDLTRKGELDEANGIVRRPRKQYQIILPENSRGEKLFEHLAPGRRIQVEGRMTNDPKIKDGTIYTNEKIYMNELTFLDSPREKQTERAINDMVVAGAMSDEEAAQAKDKMTRFYK